MQGVLRSQLQTANEETETKNRCGGPLCFLCKLNIIIIIPKLSSISWTYLHIFPSLNPIYDCHLHFKFLTSKFYIQKHFFLLEVKLKQFIITILSIFSILLSWITFLFCISLKDPLGFILPNMIIKTSPSSISLKIFWMKSFHS